MYTAVMLGGLAHGKQQPIPHDKDQILTAIILTPNGLSINAKQDYRRITNGHTKCGRVYYKVIDGSL